MGNLIPVRKTYRTLGFAGQKVTSDREGGQWACFSWVFMVQIQVTINNASRTAEEDFIHRFVFSPLPPSLHFRREPPLPSFRSSPSAAENRVEEHFEISIFFVIVTYASRHLS